MLLSRLLSDVEVLSSFFDREIADITDSTEKIRKNSAFVCVKGMHKDGHSFASEAVSSGAAAIIADFYSDVEQNPLVFLFIEHITQSHQISIH